MAQEIIRRIIELIVKAQELARSIGIANLLQPGLVKEMIIAGALGHEVIPTKHGADAHAPNTPSIKYEYLSCIEGGTGQLDRMFKEPPEERAKSLARITRNKKDYFAVFYENDQVKLKEIFELEPLVVLREAERKLDRSKNSMSHLGFSIKWARQNGKLVYEDRNTK